MLDKFLEPDEYVDFDEITVTRDAEMVFNHCGSDEEKVRAAFEFVRDGIDQAFDICAVAISASASQVVKNRSGICHAKANLLAALLRHEGIPAGFCYQRLLRGDDESGGYRLHCLNAVFLGGRWIRLDARGNAGGVDVRFSPEGAVAYVPDASRGERDVDGVYARPHGPTMDLLRRADTIYEVMDELPDDISDEPDARLRRSSPQVLPDGLDGADVAAHRAALVQLRASALAVPPGLLGVQADAEHPLPVQRPPGVGHPAVEVPAPPARHVAHVGGYP